MTLDVHSKRTVAMDADYADHAAEIREALHDECSRLAAELETSRLSGEVWRGMAIKASIVAVVEGAILLTILGYVIGRLF